MTSPFMMSAEDTALVVVDMQQRLLTAIDGCETVVSRCELLADAAAILGIPVLLTEQYPKGLGPTVDSLAQRLPPAIEKQCFSCCGASDFERTLHQLGKRKVLLCGIEAHVCVQQTAFDLATEGYAVFLAVDAVGSRREEDKRWALDRMARAGVSLTTAEAGVFEWTKVAGTPTFKQISELIKKNDQLAGK